jgi:NOL1/NOP2/sun family putative RNA methylase
MRLPESFLERMKIQLASDYNAFLEAYDKETVRGIRVNTLKISVEDFKKISPFKLRPVPWTEDGFYIESHEKPGVHPYYYAGLYYIQEPSAMLPAVMLKPSEDDVVLDLCAAPGGKSMQMAAMMKNQGLLIANDISSNRLRAVIRNAELLGVKNLIILNDYQSKIGPSLKNQVSKLLLDAPCSGEGMFKKHDDAVNAYKDYDINACEKMQIEIVDDILQVVGQDGEIVYSTCTFNETENEDMIKYMMSKRAFTGIEQAEEHGFIHGKDMEFALRVYPHLVEGEGHFAAKLKVTEGTRSPLKSLKNNQPPEVLKLFMDENLVKPIQGHFKVIKDKVFLLPPYQLKLKGVKLVKEGWLLGTIKKNRFEPSHAFALGLKKTEVKRVIDLAIDDVNVEKYLKCETLSCAGEKGFNIVCVSGYPLGWGKWNQGKLKNLYPAAWRR